MPRNTLEGNTSYGHDDVEPAMEPTAAHQEQAARMLEQFQTKDAAYDWKEQTGTDGARNTALTYGQWLVGHGLNHRDETIIAHGLAAWDNSARFSEELTRLANGPGDLATRLGEADRFAGQHAGDAATSTGGNSFSLHALTLQYARHVVATAELRRMTDLAENELQYDSGGNPLTDAATALFIRYAIADGHCDQAGLMWYAATNGDTETATAAQKELEHIAASAGQLAYDFRHGPSGPGAPAGRSLALSMEQALHSLQERIPDSEAGAMECAVHRGAEAALTDLMQRPDAGTGEMTYVDDRAAAVRLSDMALDMQLQRLIVAGLAQERLEPGQRADD